MIDVFKHLLPTGRAWRLTISKRLRQFFEGLAAFTSDVRSFIDDIYDDQNPQKTRRLKEYEDQFGLLPAGLTEQGRRDRLEGAWKLGGGQDPQHIEDALRSAGFDIYVHEWWDPIPGRPAGGSVGGDVTPLPRNPFDHLWDGVAGQPPGYPLVNKIQQAIVTGDLIGCGHNDLYCAGNIAFAASGSGSIVTYQFRQYLMRVDPQTFPYYVYVGASVFPNLATIPAARKDEFENLCLTLCPAEQWVGVLVNYN